MDTQYVLDLTSPSSTTHHGGRTALLAGATGQVGQVLMSTLLEQKIYQHIIILVRKPSGQHHPDVREVVIPDFNAIKNYSALLVADDVYLCLGTSSSNQSEFSKVDFQYPKDIAQIAFNNGASNLLFLSALGANAKSTNLYFQVKGRIEDALIAIGYASTNIFRPAVIFGSKDKSRPIQLMARIISRLLAPIIPAGLSKYLAISSHMVAQAMLSGALVSPRGVKYYESDQIRMIASENLPR